MKTIMALLLCWGLNQVLAMEIDYHGYMRAGVGRSSKGGNQECFTNNGAGEGRNEFRLGNECTNYGEIVFKSRHLTHEKPFFDTNVRLAFADKGDTSWDNSNKFAVRELYFQGGKFFNESWSYWAGKKFYREQDVFMDDFYYFQGTNTNGAGIEGVELGANRGRLSVAFLQETSSREDKTGDRPVVRRTSDGVPSTSIIDVRVNGVTLNEHQQLNFWGAFGQYPGGKAVTGDNTEIAPLDGLIVGALWSLQLPGGFNHTALSYGTGILKNLNVNAIGNYENNKFGKAASTLRFVNHLTVDFAPTFAAHFSLSGELIDNGQQGTEHGTGYWASVGIHPVYYFNDHYQLVGQVGTSMVKYAWDGNKERLLTRLSIAPQVSAGGNIWARPVIRVFYSYSFWNDNNKGKVGADSYANNTAGAAFGFQGEVWF